MAVRRGGSVTEMTKEHVVGRELGRLAVLIPPWLCWIALLVVGAVLRKVWPGAATAACVCFAGLALTGLAMHLTHRQKHLGRLLSPATTVAATLWLTVADAAGIHRSLAAAWFIGGGMFCLAWNFWLAVREHDQATGVIKGAERAGFAGLKVHGWTVWPHKQQGIIRTPPGEVIADDLIKRSTHIEAGAGLPPGALTMAPHMDNAGWAHVTVSDPRKLREPIPWPGPSRPGASIAEPIRPGRWQDGEDVDYTITNHHLQAMGSTGAGKTKSIGYTEIAETVTRYDAAVVAIDITKREQFFGPLRPCLHRFETDKDGAMDLITRVHKLVGARADYLGAKGLEKWEKGCGLTHLTVWFEECPDIINLIEAWNKYEDFESDIKAARSAAMRFVLSLQRSDYTQMPTIIRSQLDYMCFGVKNDEDARFGLSPAQKNLDCSPELWAARQPGMCYLDSASIPEEKIAMPMRCFYWGPDAKLIKEHAARYPASDRALDPLTAMGLGLSQPPQPKAQPQAQPAAATGTTGQPVSQPPAPRERLRLVLPPDKETHMRKTLDEGTAWDDDTDDLSDDAPVPTDEEMTLDPGSDLAKYQFDTRPPNRKLPPQEARAALDEWLSERKMAGHQSFEIGDIIDLADEVGHARTWLYMVLDEYCRKGILRKHNGPPIKWAITRA